MGIFHTGMQLAYRLFPVFFFVVAGTGCKPEAAVQPNQINQFPADVSNIKQELEDIKKRIGNVERKAFLQELKQKAYKTAEFDPTGGKEYQRVDANVGYFLVVLDNVEPYLDGQRITLMIGNPNNLMFSGFKLKVSWSSRYPDEKLEGEALTKAIESFQASEKEKEIDLTDTLRPGAWNKVRFTIAPAKTEVFGRLVIGITTNQVRLVGG